MSDAPPRRRRRRLKRRWVALALLAAGAVLLAPRVEHWLRVETRRWLEGELGGMMRGELHVDRVRSVTPYGLELDGVTVRAPDGAVVLTARRVRLVLDTPSLWTSTVRFSAGHAHDVRARLIPSDEYGVTLFEAFAPADDSDDDAPAERTFQFDGVQIHDGLVYGDVPGLAGLRVERLQATAQLTVDDGFRAQIRQAHGDARAPFAAPVALTRLVGEVHTDPLLGLTFHGRLRAADDAAHVRVSYGGAPRELELLVHADPISTPTLIGAGVEAAWWFTGPARGYLRLSGSPEALRWRVSAETPGGPLYARSEPAADGHTRWQLSSPALRAHQVVQGLPPLELRGAHATLGVPAGDDDPLDLLVTLDAARVAGLGLERVRLAGQYAQQRLRLRRATLRHAGGRLRASGWVDTDGDLALHVQGELPQISRQPQLRRAGARASLRTDLRLGRRGARWDARGRLQLAELRYGGVQARALALQGRAHGALRAPSLDVTGTAQDLTLSGIPVGDARFAVQGARRAYDATLALAARDGRRARAALKVTFRPKAVDVTAQRLEVRTPGRPGWRGDGQLTLHPTGLEVRRLLLGNARERLALAGRYDYDRRYAARAHLRAFSLGGLRELLRIDAADLEGAAHAVVEVSGRPDHPIINVDGTLRDVTFLGLEGMTVGYVMQYDPARFVLDSAVALPDGSELKLSAEGPPGPGETWLEALGSGRYRYGADFHRVPLAVGRPWLAWLGVDVPGGAISATLRGEGTLAAPHFTLDTQLHQLTLRGWPALDADLRVESASQLSIPGATLRDAEGALLELQARSSSSLRALLGAEDMLARLVQSDWSLRLSVPERRLDALPGPLRQTLPVVAAGQVELRQQAGDATGDLDATLRWADEAGSPPSCNLQHRPRVALRGHLARGSAALTADATLDDTRLGRAALRAPLPLSAWLRGDRAPALTGGTLHGSLHVTESREVPWLCEQVAGPVRATLEGKEVFSSAPTLRLEVRSPALQLVPHALQRTRLAGAPSAVGAGRPFSVRALAGADAARLSFKLHVVDTAGGSADAFVAAPTLALFPRAERGPLPEPLSARARFDAFEAAPLLLALPGGVRGSARVDGEAGALVDLDRQRVALDGGLRLSSGEVQLSSLGQHLTDVFAQLSFRGAGATLDALRARDFEGLLRARGELQVQGLERLHGTLALQTDNFPIRVEGSPMSRLTGRADVTADVAVERSDWRVQLKELLVQLPDKLAGDFQDLADHPDIHVVGSDPPPRADGAGHLFHVHLVADEPPFRVRRADLRADVVANVHAWLRGGTLRLRGNALLKRGFAQIYGKRFEIRQSSLSFDPDDDLDPLVALQAVHSVGTDEITVRVDGRLSDPTVTFSHSDPNVTSRGEIIAQLLGARAADNGGNDREAAGAAAGFLAGVTAGLLTEEVRRELGGVVPVLSIEATDQGFQDTRIRAGLQLDQFIQRRLGPLRRIVRGAYIEGFVSRSAENDATDRGDADPGSARGGGLLELRFPKDLVGAIEFRPKDNWRLDFSWEP